MIGHKPDAAKVRARSADKLGASSPGADRHDTCTPSRVVSRTVVGGSSPNATDRYCPVRALSCEVKRTGSVQTSQSSTSPFAGSTAWPSRAQELEGLMSRLTFGARHCST